MLTMKTILCPTDFSTQARSAFEVACALAREAHSRLVILHVERFPVGALGGTAGVPPLPTEYDREYLREELKRYQPAQPGITVEHRLEYGDPDTTILQTAREVGADLIVLGTHGRTGLRRLLMGSVAEHVVRKAPCPVLTIRTPVESELALSPVAAETASRSEPVA
jgi:nucleotide-binding universal stress UspA family protein